MSEDQQRELWQCKVFLVHKSFPKQNTSLSISAYFVRVVPTSMAFCTMLSVWSDKIVFGNKQNMV